MAAHATLLCHEVLGNPHSASLTSGAATALVERARSAILEWFDAAPDRYTLIFTANATGALKHVGESYPFSPGGRFLPTFDNHNSVNGIREYARAAGAHVDYAPLTVPDLRIDRERLMPLLDAADPGHANLFAYPAQSNFSGVRHPLDLIETAHARGRDVLLDAAAFAPTNRLSLAAVEPDFVAVSFYKMFGYPTGVGCLIARTATLARLRRPWFAGGTVNFASAHGLSHVLAPREAGFEDGTVNFLAIPAVEIGLRHLDAAGMDAIHERLRCLTAWTLRAFMGLRHANGRHMVRIYGPADTTMRGGTVTFNLYDADEHLLDYRRVEEMASAQRISLRTGCFCNPGAGETAEGVTDEDVRAALASSADLTRPRFMHVIQHRGWERVPVRFAPRSDSSATSPTRTGLSSSSRASVTRRG